MSLFIKSLHRFAPVTVFSCHREKERKRKKGKAIMRRRMRWGEEREKEKCGEERDKSLKVRDGLKSTQKVYSFHFYFLFLHFIYLLSSNCIFLFLYFLIVISATVLSSLFSFYCMLSFFLSPLHYFSFLLQFIVHFFLSFPFPTFHSFLDYTLLNQTLFVIGCDLIHLQKKMYIQ